ncbi:carboxymethylenebutenolidase homolog isoform X2 [Anolis carolinensis]|uniref:carboxymethylenebutenolidase homolog isoform X2 n=1 Tax=Anolis carolinensis TaxID=28377 RepID=UPI002F2B5F4A
MTSKDLPFQYDIGRRSNYVGRGKEIHFDNINAYVCQPDYDTNNAVILVHDIYGWQFPDTRYITDIFASNGYMTTAVFMKCLKEKYKAMKIGVVGFSWGGMAVHHLMLKNPELKAGISDYGIIRDSEDRYNLLNPTFFIFGGNDHTISPEQVTLLERKLKDYCTVDYKIKVYPGQVHGFAQCKPEDMKPKDVPFMEEARMDMIDWLNRYIMF